MKLSFDSLMSNINGVFALAGVQGWLVWWQRVFLCIIKAWKGPQSVWSKSNKYLAYMQSFILIIRIGEPVVGRVKQQ
jgi:hypothetical protein